MEWNYWAISFLNEFLIKNKKEKLQTTVSFSNIIINHKNQWFFIVFGYFKVNIIYHMTCNEVMQMKIFKKVVFSLMVLMMLFSTQVVVFAKEEIPTDTINKIGEEAKKNSTKIYGEGGLLQVDENDNIISNPADKIMTKVTLEEAETKILKKVNDIVKLVQKIVLPLCILTFIISALHVLFGLFSRRGPIWGFIGMGISGVTFTCVLYAYDIVYFICNYLSS